MKDEDVDKPGPDIPLAEMIRTLRQELVSAQAHAENETIRFGLEKVELELKVVVSRTGKVRGGVEFWVISAGGDYEKKGESSHTIKLTLNAKDGQHGGEILLSNESTEKQSGV
jgi:hypothetical protein